jgi:hypothetical protein
MAQEIGGNVSLAGYYAHLLVIHAAQGWIWSALASQPRCLPRAGDVDLPG